MTQEIKTTRTDALTAVIRYRWNATDVPTGKTANTSYYLNGAGALVTTYTNNGAVTLTSTTIDGVAYMVGTAPSAMATLALSVQAVALIFDMTPPGLVGAWVDQVDLPFFDGEAFTDAGGGTAVHIDASPAQVVLVVNGVQTQHFEVAAGEIAPLQCVFVSDPVVNYTGDTVELRARDHNGVLMFTLTGTVSMTTTTGDTVTFVTAAINTTTDLDAQLSPARAACCDRTSLKTAIFNSTTGKKLTKGIMAVGEAA